MSLKEISYLELWQPICSVEPNCLCNFGRGYYEEQFCEIIFNLDQWFRRRCLLKKQFCEFISNLGQWFRRCGLKAFLSGALAALLHSGSEPFMQLKIIFKVSYS